MKSLLKGIGISIGMVCLLCSITFSLKGQQSWGDSTYRPDIYYPRIHLFRTMPVSKKDVVFIGDSITFWGDWPELLGLKKVKNRGIPGDTSFGLLERLTETVSSKPSVVLIMIGINDVARSTPENVLLANYKRMLDTIRLYAPNTKVYFQSILPVNETFGKLNNHYKHASKIPFINKALKEWAAIEGVQYVDLFESFTDREGRLLESLSWDGVHLTIEGYHNWLRVLKAQKIIS